MPFYKTTGMHSQRHPFLGPGDIVDMSNVLQARQALAFGAVPPTKTATVLRAVLSGTAAGLVTFLTARAFSIERGKAKKLSFALGGTTLLSSLALGFLAREMSAVKAAVPSPTVPITAATK